MAFFRVILFDISDLFSVEIVEVNIYFFNVIVITMTLLIKLRYKKCSHSYKNEEMDWQSEKAKFCYSVPIGSNQIKIS